MSESQVPAKSGKRQSEDSITARVAVASAAVVANGALAMVSTAAAVSLFSLAALLLGHRISWLQRHHKRSVVGQLLMFLGLSASVVYLVADLFYSAFGGNLPQASFAVLTQAITGYDLKTRRNLYSHLFHSLVILYIASLFAWTALFVFAILGWGLAFWSFLTATRRGARPRTTWNWSLIQSSARRNAAWTISWVLCAVAVFAALPEFAGRPLAVPLLTALPTSSSPGVALPPVLPLAGGVSPSTGAIDLRVRGALGDEVAFHVRASSPSYWRGYALENYDGDNWTTYEPPPQTVNAVNLNVQIVDEQPAAGKPTLSQSFFISRPIGSTILSAYPLSELYFPARTVTLSTSGTVGAPAPLGGGVNYGAVSVIRDTSPATLRSRSATRRSVSGIYYQLPADLPARVRSLAYQLASGSTTEYDRVLAVQSYLSSNFSYNIDSPVPATGQDAVDQFLFVDHQGFCEQFASALTVLLRADGVPARVAVGYATGSRDAISGTYEVHNSDAHAWTEVYFPGTGWVPFDASPGFAAHPSPTSTSPWFLSDPSRLVSLGGVSGGATAVGSGVLAVVLVTGFAAVVLRVSRRRALSPAARAYAKAQRRLGRARLPTREPADTIAEHLEILRARAPVAAQHLEPIARALEYTLYEPDPGNP